LANNLLTSTDTGRKQKKGSSTQKKKKNRSTPNFYEVKIRITREEFVRGKPYFESKKDLDRFVMEAYREKINRAEANDKAYRLRTLTVNMDILESVLKEMFTRGRLNFLNGKNDG
jgi:hypothetical protein